MYYTIYYSTIINIIKATCKFVLKVGYNVVHWCPSEQFLTPMQEILYPPLTSFLQKAAKNSLFLLGFLRIWNSTSIFTW